MYELMKAAQAWPCELVLWRVRRAALVTVLLADGAVWVVGSLNVQEVSALRQVDWGVEEPFAGVFFLFPLSETDGGVFVTVSGGPGAAHDGGFEVVVLLLTKPGKTTSSAQKEGATTSAQEDP